MTWTHVSNFQLVRFYIQDFSRWLFLQWASPGDWGNRGDPEDSPTSISSSSQWRVQWSVRFRLWKMVSTLILLQSLRSSSLLQFLSEIFCLHLLAARCYVDDSNTCGDAKSSSFGAPFSWSCQACQSLANKGESLTSEREQMHEGVELSCGFKLFLIKLIKKLTKWNPSLNGRHFQLSSFSLRECNPKLTDFSPRLPPSHSRGDTTHPPAHHTNQDFTSK